jgi:hypothetical protein
MLQKGGEIAPIAETGGGIMTRDLAVNLRNVPVETVFAGIVPRVGEADDDYVILIFSIKQVQLVAVLLPQTVTPPFGKGAGRTWRILKADSGADFFSC